MYLVKIIKGKILLQIYFIYDFRKQKLFSHNGRFYWHINNISFLLTHVTIISSEIFEVILVYNFLSTKLPMNKKLVIYKKNNIAFTILCYLDFLKRKITYFIVIFFNIFIKSFLVLVGYYNLFFQINLFLIIFYV